MINNQFAKDTVTQMLQTEKNYADVLVLYGIMNQDIVNSSLKIIENKLAGLKYSKTIISKTKLIGVELMENIYKHQSKTSTISSYFQVVINSEGLCMYTGNSVSENNYTVLNEKLSDYQNMSLDELKNLYLDKLSVDEISESGNAGLGLISILNRSNKEAKHELVKISNEEYFFKLEVNINNAVLMQ
jgi:Family of unknown function (DUF6272)